MNDLSSTASTFPDHIYDFGEHVYIEPICQGGMVDGIWQQSHGVVYHVIGVFINNSEWWLESQLQVACPSCLKPWTRDSRNACVHCGYIQLFD